MENSQSKNGESIKFVSSLVVGVGCIVFYMNIKMYSRQLVNSQDSVV